MKNISIIFWAIFILTACTKKQEFVITPTPQDNSSDSLLVWQVPLGEDSTQYISINTQLLDNGILYSRSSINFTHNEPLILADKTNGNTIWKWNEYITHHIGQRILSAQVIDDVIVINSSQDNYGINRHTGQTLWSNLTDDGNPYITSFGDKIFHTVSHGSPPYSDSTSITMCEANNGNWREIIKFHKKDDYEVNCTLPVVETEKGDTLLYFDNRSIVISPYDGKIDFYCYNMTADTMVWQKEDFDPQGSANIEPPIVDDKHVYHVGMREVYCLDKKTGHTIWKFGDTALAYGFLGTTYVLHNNNFIIKRSDGTLYCINKDTGTLNWSIPKSEAGIGSAKMRVYDDKLYYACGKLYIVDIPKGEVLHVITSPNVRNGFPEAIMIHAISVDVENKRMYTSDGNFLMCLKLPED